MSQTSSVTTIGKARVSCNGGAAVTPRRRHRVVVESSRGGVERRSRGLCPLVLDGGVGALCDFPVQAAERVRWVPSVAPTVPAGVPRSEVSAPAKSRKRKRRGSAAWQAALGKTRAAEQDAKIKADQI